MTIEQHELVAFLRDHGYNARITYFGEVVFWDGQDVVVCRSLAQAYDVVGLSEW